MHDAIDKVLLRTWKILVSIKEKETLNDIGDPFINYGDASESDLRIIAQLHQLHIVDVQGFNHDDKSGSSRNIRLKINQPAFNNTYKFHHEIFNQTQIPIKNKTYRGQRSFGTEIKDQFGFNDSTFFLKRVASSDLSIFFNPQKNGEPSDTFCLMRALIEYLKTHGQLNKNILSVLVPREQLVKYIQKTFPEKEISPNWIKTTKSNLAKKIQEIDKENEFVEISNFQKNGYLIKLTLPNVV